MKKIFSVGILMAAAASLQAQKKPEVMKTGFSKEALTQYVYTPGGDSLTMGDVLKKHKKETVVLDLWAGWCKDCIAVMEESKALSQKYPKAAFVYLSLDRSDSAWKSSMAKHGLVGEENYWFKAGWKNKFNNYIDLNWIPRYMVLRTKGKIGAYYIVKPSDPELIELLEQSNK